MQRLIAWSVGAALVALVGILGVYRLQRGVMLDPATFSVIHSGTGWHAVETLPPDGMRFRWTNGSATLELPDPGVGLRRWQTILANPAGFDTNATWCLGEDCVTLPIMPQPRQFIMFVDANASRLQLNSPAALEAAGSRQLGIAVGAQRWQTLGNTTPPRITTLLVMVAALTLTGTLIRLGQPTGAAFGIGVGGVVVLLAWQQLGLWRYRLLEPLLALVIIGAMAALLVDRWRDSTELPPTAQTWQRHDWLGLAALIGIWLLTRLPLLTLPDRVGDLELFARWATAAARDGIAAPYQIGSDNMPGNLYVLWASGMLARWLGVSFGEPPLGFGAAVLLKGPALMAELGVAGLIWRWASRNRSAWAALLWPLGYLLMPTIWINAGWWGQTDALVIATLVGSIWLLERQHGRWSWLLLAIALLLKMQALVLVPVLALLTVRRWGGRQLILNGLLAGGMFGLGLSPMLLAGAADSVHAAIFQASQRWPYPTAGAYNAWYILTAGRGNLEPGGAPTLIFDTDVWLLGVSYRHTGMLFLALGLVASGWAAYHSASGRRWYGLVIATLALFVVPTQIHERFMSFTFAPLLLAASLDRRLMVAYVALASANTINLLRNLNFIPWLHTTLASPLWAWISASITVITFGWLLWRLLFSTTQPITEAP